MRRGSRCRAPRSIWSPRRRGSRRPRTARSTCSTTARSRSTSSPRSCSRPTRSACSSINRGGRRMPRTRAVSGADHRLREHAPRRGRARQGGVPHGRARGDGEPGDQLRAVHLARRAGPGDRGHHGHAAHHPADQAARQGGAARHDRAARDQLAGAHGGLFRQQRARPDAHADLRHPRQLRRRGQRRLLARAGARGRARSDRAGVPGHPAARRAARGAGADGEDAAQDAGGAALDGSRPARRIRRLADRGAARSQVLQELTQVVPYRSSITDRARACDSRDHRSRDRGAAQHPQPAGAALDTERCAPARTSNAACA
jgi:hypothetical protein